jgi:hypothetical protein
MAARMKPRIAHWGLRPRIEVRGDNIVDCGLKKARGANPQSAIRNPQSSWGCRSGVTLTEVVVASALLVISVVPLLKALTLAQVQDRALERKSWSLMLAQQELESLRVRCLCHYDASYRVSSKALRDGYLCTVADDRHPSLRTVAVSVGLDQDGDGVLAVREIEANLCTRLARQ